MEFISISKRSLHQININVGKTENESDIITEIDNLIAQIPSSDMIKIVFDGEVSEEFNLDLDYINRTYKQRFFMFKAKNSTTVKINYEKYENDVSLKGEFIRLVKNSNDIAEEDKGEIIARGIGALMGKEFS